MPYIVTGATAAILYGQPRTTNDLDVVIELRAEDAARLHEVFPEEDYYVPPEDVIQVELRRAQRGHLNVLHHDSGFKAALYPVANDALHRWALPRRRAIDHAGRKISVIPLVDGALGRSRLTGGRAGRCGSAHLLDRAQRATGVIDTLSIRNSAAGTFRSAPARSRPP